MSSIPSLFMKKLLQIISPDSYAYDNILDKKISMMQYEQANKIVSKLQVGDIIFTKTPNLLHQMGRKYVSADYDHVSVVINQTQGIHISPPVISRMTLNYLVLPSQQPFIFRLNWPQQMIQQFVTLLHSFIGESYDYLAILSLMKDKLKSQLSFPNKYEFSLNDIKYHKICTNIVCYSLGKANQLLQLQMKNNIKSYQYYELGAFLPDDIIKLLSKTSTTIIHQHKVSQPLLNYSSPLESFYSMFSSSGKKRQFIKNLLKQGLVLLKKFSRIPRSDIRKYQMYFTIVWLLYTLYKGDGYLNKLQSIIKLFLLLVDSTLFHKIKLYAKL